LKLKINKNWVKCINFRRQACVRVETKNLFLIHFPSLSTSYNIYVYHFFRVFLILSQTERYTRKISWKIMQKHIFSSSVVRLCCLTLENNWNSTKNQVYTHILRTHVWNRKKILRRNECIYMLLLLSNL
jgi:hypothetical protein